MTESSRAAADDTEVGSYFVANYPPFSVWTPEAVDDRRAAGALLAAGRRDAARALPAHPVLPQALSLLLLPRLHGQERQGGRGVSRSCSPANGSCTRRLPAFAGRPLDFVYFGGGTPSFLSTKQLEGLVARLDAVAPWSGAEEVTFECEPGTLTEAKLSVIRRIGVTRLSLGVENFDDRLLELNGRAHRSKEIGRAYAFARSLDFPQINIDLIAGMLGETDENWHDTVRKTLELEPDSVTIYQMELPFNTTISRDKLAGSAPLRRGGGRAGRPSAAGSTRRLPRSSVRAITWAAPTPPSRTRRAARSSIAIGSGKVRTSPASAWLRSGT